MCIRNRKMVALGCMENPHVDAVVGMHNEPNVPYGCVAVKKGPLMALSLIHIYVNNTKKPRQKTPPRQMLI